ncbi:MAG: Crp/Fnr family transcriptional regulator [Fusobacterium sp.]|nr:Crp/Fnr family transcriptional regulator [Fusobacterium sp.]
MMEILKESLIFKGLTSEEIKDILGKIRYETKSYKNKENIAFRGDKINGLNIIIKGSISTEMLAKDGNIRKIEKLEESDVLASAFIFGTNNFYPVDLVAENKVEILNISRENFLKILSLENRILENFLNEISNKTQFLSAKIWSSVNNKTIGEKFSEFIKNKQKNNELKIDNLQDLADSFGVARPSLSRVLREYIEEKKLERIGRNRYKILDKDFFELS